LQAQEELLAGVARTASRRTAPDVNAETELVEEVIPAEEMEMYDRAMSPPLIDITKLSTDEREIDIVLDVDDRQALVSQSIHIHFLFSTLLVQFQQRRAVAASRFVPKISQPEAVEVQNEEAASGADLASEALYRAEAEKDLDEEEELFNLEENIANPTTYNWEDKYRPRKPRYFNRVHTGYEWNKYNQTHYEYATTMSFTFLAYSPDSTDNPPPKVVQGYKVCRIAFLMKSTNLSFF